MASYREMEAVRLYCARFVLIAKHCLHLSVNEWEKNLFYWPDREQSIFRHLHLRKRLGLIQSSGGVYAHQSRHSMKASSNDVARGAI